MKVMKLIKIFVIYFIVTNNFWVYKIMIIYLKIGVRIVIIHVRMRIVVHRSLEIIEIFSILSPNDDILNLH